MPVLLDTDQIWRAIVRGPTPTTGTVEETLATIALPYGALLYASEWNHLLIEAVFKEKANANTKVTRVRVGGLTGNPNSAISNGTSGEWRTQRVSVRKSFAEATVATSTEWAGFSQSYRDGNAGAAFSSAFWQAVVPEAYSGVVNVVATGEDGTAAADSTLLYLFVELSR